MDNDIEKKYTESISSLMLLYMKNKKIGYIHSIFKDSLNIKFGENLIYISGLKKNLVSFGCRISDKKIEKIIQKAKIGDIVIKKDEKLVFYTELGLETVYLPLNRTKKLHIPFIKNRKKVFENIMEKIQNIDFESKTGLEYEKYEIEEKFMTGLTEENQKYFTGRGKGLTPSGDDILMGYSFICSLCGEKIELLYGSLTTDISRQYFDAFNKGYVSQNLLNLLKYDTEKAVEKLTKTGHTSGYDTLLGIYLGIKKKLQKMEEIL